MANSRQIIQMLKSKVKSLEKGLINDIANSVEARTRANFNRAIAEVPADDPFVSVSSFVVGKSCKIKCFGSQVLFIEFGAGAQNSMKEIDVFRGDTQYSRVMAGNGFKFIDNALTEVAPRPFGIVPLGMYHSSLRSGMKSYNAFRENNPQWQGGRGKNDFWVYRTYNGRMAMGDEVWRVSKEGNTYIKTRGIRPIRALYRGVRSGIRKEIARRLGQ